MTSEDRAIETAESEGLPPLRKPDRPVGDVIENMIQERGLNAPRVTPERIEQVIVAAQYYVVPGTMVTICCLTLRNGFNVVGHSACASPENFNEEVGREAALRDAKRQIWALEGYLLREQLHREALAAEHDDAADALAYLAAEPTGSPQ